MANTNLPIGIQPLYMTEARKTAMILPITNNYGTALYQLDPALAVTAGRIEKAATTGTWLGVILELFRQETPKSLRTERLIPVQYMAASPGTTYEYFALVTMDPNLYFVMMEDGDTASLQITDNWGACDFVFGTANTTTGIGNTQIDSDSADNTGTRPIQLIWPAVNMYDIDAGAYMTVSAAGAAGNYAKWIVRNFYPQLGPGTVASALA